MNSLSRKPRVLVHGWYGAGNVGDELLLRMLRSWCEEAGAQVAVLSVNPEYTRTAHGLEAVDANDFPAVARLMSQSDLFVLGGGGLFQTHYAFTLPTLYSYGMGDVASYARPALMARQMGVPALMWAQGVGPLDGDQARSVVRDVYANALRASVRDEASLELLREIGVSGPISVAPDPVWALPVSRSVPADGNPGKQRLGLVVRPWEIDAGWEEHFLESIREAVDPAAYTLVWIPFQVGEENASASDAPLMRSLASRLEGYEHAFVELSDSAQAVSALGGCTRLLCMRLHAQILAFKLGVPALCVEYDPKMSHTSELLGVHEALRVSTSAPGERWRRGLAALLAPDCFVADAARVDAIGRDALEHRSTLLAAIGHVAGGDATRVWSDSGFDWLGTWSSAWLHRQIGERDGKLAVLEDVAAERVREVARLEEEAELRRTELQAVRSGKDAVEAECGLLRKSSEKLGQTLESTRQESLLLHAESARLRQECEQLRQERTSLQEERGQLRQESSHLHAERVRLYEENKGLRAEFSRLDNESERLRIALEKEQFHLRELERDLASERDQLSAVATSRDEAMAESGRLQMTVADMQAQADSVRQMFDALSGEVQALRVRNEESRAHIDSVERALWERTRECERMTASLSWRITHPIRFLRALLVLPMPEKKELVYSALRSTFWSMPEPLRRRMDRLRTRVGNRHARRAVATVQDAQSPEVADWLSKAASAERIAIVPSAFEFDELANQRPINLAKYLASKGYLVVFAAWQWSRGEQLSKSNRMVFPGIWQIDMYALIDHLAELAPRHDRESVYFLTLPAPELVGLHRVARQKGLSVVYDILDEWEAFNAVGQAPWYSRGHEEEAVLAADVVVAVSPPLVEKFGHLRTDLHVVGNGYTAAVLGTDHKFVAARDRGERTQQVIGYFGHLTDAWFDWGVVLEAARRMPNCRFEIIGYGEPQWVRDAAASMPNLVLVGKVPPSELWRYAEKWSAGLAPFKPGPLAVAIDPIKVYEYLYLGLPTVCTGIPHLALLPGVAVVEGEEAFAEACQRKLQEPLDLEAAERVLEDTTWNARFDTIMGFVDDGGLGKMYAV